MTRYSKTNVSSISGVNSELQKIATAIDSLLDRDGTAPNSMESDLDLNSNSILNVANGVAGTDAVNLNQLTALLSAASVTARTILKATATQDQVLFTAPTYVIGNNSLEVFVNGQRQFVSDNYSETSTTSFTFNTVGDINDGDIIYAVVVTIA